MRHRYVANNSYKASCTSAKESLSTESLRLSSLGQGATTEGKRAFRGVGVLHSLLSPQVYDVPYIGIQVNLLKLGSGR